jgi:tetratricopeptide (TPR) repeat protein
MLGAFALALSCGVAHGEKAGEEILYPSKAFSKLDTFEALNLEDADKLYGKRDYAGAYSAYKAYSFEFTKSPALSYVLLRMGRCLHQVGKRNAAIKAYQDVVDYFPDDVRYAAAALYYIGQCHQQNGDVARQTAVWARMVKDDDYVAQPNSGTALVHLAGAMDKLEKFEEAAEYRWRTAVNFAVSNERAAADARNAVIYHYACRRPNHDKLKEFFVATNAFADRNGKGDNPQEDRRYWDAALGSALGAKENKESVGRYWVGKFGNLFPKDDGLRVKLFNLQRVYEKDKDAWAARMDKQFKLTPATLGRVAGWIAYFNWDPTLELAFAMKHGGPLVASAKPDERTVVIEQMRWNRDKFYEKWVLKTVSGLKPEEKVWLMNRLRHPCGLHEQATSVLRQVNVNGMADTQIRGVGMFASYYLPEEDVIRYFAKMKDKLAATKARFDYYVGDRNHPRNPEKAIIEIPALRKSTEYAGPELSWTEAMMYRRLNRHEEAIKAYRAANKQPDSTWAVTDCLVAMKQYGAAIKNVAGLESVKATAPAACLKIADIYKAAGDKGKEVEQLQLVLRRYRGSDVHVRAALGSVMIDRVSRNFGAALEELDKLLSIKVPGARSKIHYARAEVLMDQEAYKEALEEVEAVLRREPGHEDARILRGKIEILMRRLVEATEIELGLTREDEVMELVEKGAGERLVELFNEAQARESGLLGNWNAAGILDALVAAEHAPALDVARGALKHGDPLVRRAAVQAVFAIGGDAELKTVFAFIRQATALEDFDGAERALLSKKDDPEHVQRVSKAAITLLPRSEPPLRRSLAWVLGQFGGEANLAAIQQAAETTEDDDDLKEMALALAYSPDRAASENLLTLVKGGKRIRDIVAPLSIHRMVGRNGMGDVTDQERVKFARGILNLTYNERLVSFLSRVHTGQAMQLLYDVMKMNPSMSAKSIIASAEGIRRPSKLDSQLASEVLAEVIEYIEVTHLRGGMTEQVDDWRKAMGYTEWKGLQARAGQALLKFHKPKESAIPTFDDIDLDL